MWPSKASLEARSARDESRAFVGIDCDVPHSLSVTPDSYRGAYVNWGVPGQVHISRVINTGDPVADFSRAYATACLRSSNVYISGTAQFFADRSGGEFELTGTLLWKKDKRSNSHAA